MSQPLEDLLDGLQKEALEEISRTEDLRSLEEVRVRYLGRKGRLTQLLRGLRDLPPEERPRAGERANALKGLLEEELERRKEVLGELERRRAFEAEKVDVTLPGVPFQEGRLHPITQVMEEVVEIFVSMGFEVAQGPEVEWDYYNFEALNIPRDHPARDMHDTFYFSSDVLLRTHTSPVQIRVMEAQRPPVQIVAPGAVYRRDSDISHTPMFHQVEGLMVDEGVSFAHLKGVLTLFVHRFFGKETALRFRPSYFPFTEPSA
ncbi:MAG: phenylalanine--tRNA ligase subunit alpha, partial [Deltaproteobacteria bacterium]